MTAKRERKTQVKEGLVPFIIEVIEFVVVITVIFLVTFITSYNALKFIFG